MGFERRDDLGVTDRGQPWLVACRSGAQRSHMHPKATFQMIFGVISAGQILTGSQPTGTLESNSARSVNPTKRVVTRSRVSSTPVEVATRTNRHGLNSRRIALTASVAVYDSSPCRREFRTASPIAVSNSCPSKGLSEYDVVPAPIGCNRSSISGWPVMRTIGSSGRA